MHVLIVYAHPSPNSFNAALKNLAVEVFTESGHTVEVSDLVAQGFNPVTHANDFAEVDGDSYYSIPAAQLVAFEAGTTAPDIAAEQQKVDAADLVLFQFPMWIYSMPAILKGWVERVMSFGYSHNKGRMFEKGHMAGKRAMLSLTTNGRFEAFHRDGPHGSIDDLLRPIRNGLRFQGFEMLPPFIAYDVVRADQAARETYLSELRDRLVLIDAAVPIEAREVVK
jgi:NAD(P)H dehydrogenase (quinone)